MQARNLGIVDPLTCNKMLLRYYVQEYLQTSSTRSQLLRPEVCAFISSNVTETFILSQHQELSEQLMLKQTLIHVA